MPTDKQKSLELLQRSLEGARKLAELHKYSPDHSKWERTARRAIASSFGEGSQYWQDFESELKPYSREDKLYATAKGDAFRRAIPGVIALFESLIEEVQNWEDSEVDNDRKRVALSDAKIFIIHGHDAGPKEQVARFVSQLGLTPIILHEQSNQGRAVIEKFEQHADVSFAIALLTPDDVGSSNSKPHHLQPRPRQNVLFEFGYFIGKLGRKYVCGLVKGQGLEIPSDYSGVLYIELDERGAWKPALIKELKAADLPIDTNRVF